jgi:hypothetical protein
MDGNTLEYVKETGFTNAAAATAESAAKPESTLKLDLVSTSAKVIAHFIKASRQVLDDISQLKSMIDQRLMYGLAYVEETRAAERRRDRAASARDHPAGDGLLGAGEPGRPQHHRRHPSRDAAGGPGRISVERHRPAPDRLGGDRDAEGQPGPLHHRQSARHGAADPVVAAGGRDPGDHGPEVPDRRVQARRPGLRPLGCPGRDRLRQRRLHQEPGDDPR